MDRKYDHSSIQSGKTAARQCARTVSDDKGRLTLTSEVAIHVCILTMNLWKRLRKLLFALIQRVLRAPLWCREPVVISLLVVLCAGLSLKIVIVQWTLDSVDTRYG